MIVQSRHECQQIYKKMDFDLRYGIAANPTMDKFFRKLGLNRLYNKNFELCMKSSEKSPCFGDSGGPLICEGNEETYNQGYILYITGYL